jgi:hypothetical protein
MWQEKHLPARGTRYQRAHDKHDDQHDGHGLGMRQCLTDLLNRDLLQEEDDRQDADPEPDDELNDPCPAYDCTT